MYAGKRNKLITIQSFSEVTSETGEVYEDKDNPTTVCKTWASIEPISSRERYLVQQSMATTTHMIKMLYRSDITSRMQAVWNGRTFVFDSVVDPEEANRELIIMATEVF
jgi:SPP1 family predicted phage head-tail adaptor